MRKRITSLAMSAALVIALFSAPRAYALPDESVYYAVYYSCICGPVCYGTLIGEWTLACNGQWYGWGVRPYQHSCAQWVESEVIEDCDPWN